MINKSNFGLQVALARRKLGMRQYSLAEKVGITTQYMNQIENGRVALDTIGSEIFDKLVEVLKLSREEIEPPSANSPVVIQKETEERSEEDLLSILEAEKKGWEKLEASLRDTIAQQQQTIQFLMGLVERSKVPNQ